MTLITYPILLIVAVILFYILGKKNGTEKEVVKTVTQYSNETVSLYHDETAEQFILRCQNFIVAYFTKKELNYLVTEDSSVYQLHFEDDEGANYFILIEPVYTNNLKAICVNAQISTSLVKDDKLGKVSELANRLNASVWKGRLYLDYTNRHIHYENLYHIGNIGLEEEYLDFCIGYAFKAVNYRVCFNRVTQFNEEPVLVAIDYLN